MVLVPQIVESVSIPVVASGGIVESRGYVAALALGAQGVQMGSRFLATRECISHQNYKEAILAAIDSGTVIIGGDRWPTRVLRNGVALRLKERGLAGPGNDLDAWEAELGMAQARAAMVDGDLEAGIAYTGAGAGLISEILSVDEVFKELLDGAQTLARSLA
jgi:enoyl-[acyl-carrier protein] reductase II